jgi:hypothetical protein
LSLEGNTPALPNKIMYDKNLDSALTRAEKSADGLMTPGRKVSDALLVEENGPADDTLDEHSSNLLLGPGAEVMQSQYA